MPSIQVLDNSLINKIAAGEVIERPASVVKELVENAIDANATSVTIEIRDGGSSFIKITDNGAGIPAGQVRTAFMRHATSKITNLESLENVLTLGFRGEALSSIAGVAQVELLTKTRDGECGVRIEIHGGVVIEETEEGCAEGTSFTVKNLFFNTPARKKFMKSNSAESAYITELISRIALSHPEIAFKYINNSSVILQTSGNGDTKACVLAVYGKEAVMKMMEVGAADDNAGLSIKGLAAKPEFNRSNRQYCNFFINKRYIRSALLQSAVEDAYRTRLPIGRFPVYALSLCIPANEIDVNVHPTKMDVRFSDEQVVYQFVLNAVRNALQKEILITNPFTNSPFSAEKPSVTEQETVKTTRAEIQKGFAEASLIAEKFSMTIPTSQTPNKSDVTKKPEEKEKSKEIEKSKEKWKREEEKQEESEINKNQQLAERRNLEPQILNVSENKGITPKVDGEGYKPADPVVKPFFCNYIIVGQILATYWIVEQEQSVYLIDQHAAHERVLFEELTKKLTKSEVVQQRLVTPLAMKLSPLEMEAVEQNMGILEKMGFELEIFGSDTYALRAVPYLFKKPAEFSYFNEILDILVNSRAGGEGSGYEGKINSIAMIACKAAVKGNDRLSNAEVRALIDKMLRLENPFTCPHGRPTIVEITKRDFEKIFKRV